MFLRNPTAALVFAILTSGLLRAQVGITGRVVDENGTGVGGVRVELRGEEGPPVVASSDPAGNFRAVLPGAGAYAIRAERLGFYVFQGVRRQFEAGGGDLTIVLNHLQEYSDRIDVTYSPPAIDPQQATERKELTGTEAQTVPYPAPHDYRNALQLIDGVVMDNSGRPHFNGGQTSQASYSMDGFNISNPVTGRLDARVNIETIQSMEVETSRFSAENGRGSAGVLELRTKMGDDRWRFGGTNFVPGIAVEGGLRLAKWTPRLEVSGPLWRGRAWFHNGFDAFYSNDVISGLPAGQNRTTGINTSNMTRFQVNLTRANSIIGSFLVNLGDERRMGLSFINPEESTTNRRQTLYMSTLRDQWYLGRGALLEVGVADSRGVMRDQPQGDQIYQITPFGRRGNYYINLDRHFFRQQVLGNLFLPTVKALGTHELKFGVDMEREAFHQKNQRHDYEVLRADDSIARRVSFLGSPFQERKNLEMAQYIQDSWTPVDGVVLESGLRAEWNEVVRELEIGPRFALVWAPRRLLDTKLAAGWGIYHDSISLEPLARDQDQESLSTFYSPGLPARGPIATSFAVRDRDLRTPAYHNASVSLERKLPREFYLRSSFVHRTGNRGLTFMPTSDLTPETLPGDSVAFQLVNARRDRYDAWDLSLRHSFAGRFEWFASYTRSSARSSAAVDYSLENPIFAAQSAGPYPWDTPHRFQMWGWAPLPLRVLPHALQWLTRNTTAAYLLEWRSGFPFSVVSEEGVLLGNPNGRRMPAYFNINLHLERQFRALHCQWAWRFGFNNLTNNGNPNVVNNVAGTPQFLTYGRGQVRAFSVRLRLIGRK
jgi:hypothetical protein